MSTILIVIVLLLLFGGGGGSVPLLCRPKCSFKPLPVRRRRGFSIPVLSVGDADCRSR